MIEQELKEAYTAWHALPDGLTDEEAGPVYTRWLDAYAAAYKSMPVERLQEVLRRIRIEM